MPSLNGITVLDLTHAVSGPFCTMLLTELGARVIKVEPPGGDHFRPSQWGGTFAAINRNKQGVCLDLKASGSGAVMERLIDAADLFVQSFTPGTIERLGYGYEVLSARNPGIIYCSISGFGPSGPYRELRGYDAVIQAMSGIMMVTGEPDQPPVRVGPPLIDMGTGMYMTIAILDALRERDRGAGGRRLDFNLLETALSWMSPYIAAHSITGRLPTRHGSALPTYSPYQVFQAGDGYVFIGASTQRFWERLCPAIGMAHLMDDPRFVDMPSRVANRAALTEILEAYLATTTVAAAVDKIREAKVPCAPVNALDDILADPHVAERGLLSRHLDPEAGEVVQVKNPIGGRLDERTRPAPRLGEHGRAVLADLGFASAEIDRLCAAGVLLGTD